MLQVDKINTFYGLSQILFEVSLKIKMGETVCLLGRNGVGKTTTLKSIIGLTPPSSGNIKYAGQEIRGLKTHRIIQLGIGYVPEDRIIFPNLTVRENLQMGERTRIQNRDIVWTFEKIYQMYPILKQRESQYGGTLSGGEQQMLTIARTLMGNPTLLLLDEPSEGLAPLIVKELEIQVQYLKTVGITILLSEQNSSFTLRLSNRTYILEKGYVRWDGEVTELMQRPEIMNAYLGV